MKKTAFTLPLVMCLASVTEGADHKQPRLRLGLAVGVSTLTQEIEEGGKGNARRVTLGGSPLLEIGVLYAPAPSLNLRADLALAPLHAASFNHCSVDSRLECRFPVTPDTSDVQTYEYGLALEVGPAGRRVSPYLGAGIGAVTYGHDEFVRSHDTRLAWDVRGGIRLSAGQRRVAVAVRRVVVPNPPWGLRAFTDIQVRVAIELALAGS